jgi:TRAP-type C4-dicarboxylate transport system permease small subunit
VKGEGTALRWLDRLEEVLIATLMAVATALIFVAVMQRYGLSNMAALVRWARAEGYEWLEAAALGFFHVLNFVRLTWAQEVCVIMFIWMAKFGAAYGVRTGIHVGVDLLLMRLPEGPRHATIVFGLLAGAFFTAVVGVLGAYLVWHQIRMGQVTAVAELPMWLVYLALPAGSFLMCFRFLQVALSFHRTGQLPHYDHSAVNGTDAAADDGGAR